MKHFLFIAVSFILLTLVTNAKAAVGSSLKTEGSCSGNLSDGSEISFEYFSDFNGCQKVSKGAITFTEGIEGLITGSRSFKGNQDIYNFPKNKLTFADSTGNTSGKFSYRDQNNKINTITVQCEIRDYEYTDCE